MCNKENPPINPFAKHPWLNKKARIVCWDFTYIVTILDISLKGIYGRYMVEQSQNIEPSIGLFDWHYLTSLEIL